MYLRFTPYIILCFFIICLDSFCQDTLYLKNGTQVNSKVATVGIENIEYRKSNLLDGPVYIVSKNDIDSIKYTNGVVDIFITHSGKLKRSFVADTIIYNVSDSNVVDTLVINGIVFYIRYAPSFVRRRDLVMDFTNYSEGNIQVWHGEVTFLFELKNKDFILFTYISGSLVIAPFRFESPGSLRRFKKLARNRLQAILFDAFSFNLAITEQQSDAFNKMFEVYYPSSD